MKIPKKLFPLIGIVLFIYIIYSVGWQKILLTIAKADINFLLISVPFIIPGVIIKAIKWKMVVNRFDKKFPLMESLKIWLVGLFFGAVTPGRFGDFIKTFYLKNRGVRFGTSLSTIFVDRVMDVLSLVVLSTLGSFFILFIFKRLDISLYLFFLTAILIIIILILSRKKSMLFFAKPVFNYMVPSKYKRSFKAGFNDFYHALSVLRDSKKVIFVVFALSLFSWLTSYVQAIFIFKSLGADVPYIYLVTFLSTEVLLSLLPISISGFGTREFVYVTLFSLIGITPEVAISFGFINVLFTLLTAFVGLLIWLVKPFKIDFRKTSS